MNRGAWWATVHRGHKESDKSELSLSLSLSLSHTHTHTHTVLSHMQQSNKGIQMVAETILTSMLHTV